jgi:hypothetical protein
MAQPPTRNNNDFTDRQNAVLERIEALEVCITKKHTNQIKPII